MNFMTISSQSWRRRPRPCSRGCPWKSGQTGTSCMTGWEERNIIPTVPPTPVRGLIMRPSCTACPWDRRTREIRSLPPRPWRPWPGIWTVFTRRPGSRFTSSSFCIWIPLRPSPIIPRWRMNRWESLSGTWPQCFLDGPMDTGYGYTGITWIMPFITASLPWEKKDGCPPAGQKW